ncbi:GNAT family N-acetyltransferase [Nocardioides sp. GY 10113]|uniref:GNAT family N-acetyltransferase n=1 Tax=Nocardioides sp. GY 10113 TaxID=2569761 RepID=UPI001F0E19AE|nr:GNAT family N-acetyltransferase [Nocardioides sp. GY 10113]
MTTAPALPEGIRAATADDVPDILRLIRELAEYERDPDAVVNTEEKLRTWLFGPDAVAEALLAEYDGRVVGVALWYRSYSTWTGVPGVYLEDLFVEEEHRGRGFGKAFFRALAAIVVARGYERLEWVVLDWNTPSIEFYERLGGRPMKGWSTYRLVGEDLRALAE